MTVNAIFLAVHVFKFSIHLSVRTSREKLQTNIRENLKQASEEP